MIIEAKGIDLFAILKQCPHIASHERARLFYYLMVFGAGRVKTMEELDLTAEQYGEIQGWLENLPARLYG